MITVSAKDNLETHDLNLETVDLYGDLTFLVSGLKGEDGEVGSVIFTSEEEPEYRKYGTKYYYVIDKDDFDGAGREPRFGIDLLAYDGKLYKLSN